jgi:hypothetical protein
MQTPSCAGLHFWRGPQQTVPHRGPPVLQPQTPLEQVASAGQTLPQVPQLFGSVFVSTQVPAHTVPGQVHAPLEQTSPALQVLPQVPQFPVSLDRSRQTPEQQAGMVPAQVMPQAPQLLVSVLVSTQTPLQSVSPLGHTGPATQFPLTQEEPVLQHTALVSL